MIVADALRRNGVHAALTGGACAAVYTGGRVASRDADFILLADTSQDRLDRAMAAVGFTRRGDRYVHRASGFFVEFPRGPLAIGEDLEVRPVMRREGTWRGLLLSATDACRDRLAAFYHWRDLSSLRAAVEIAAAAPVAMARIERWSRTEGAGESFERFRALVHEARARKRRKPPGSSPRPRRRAGRDRPAT